jgi:hypothetical protein
MIVAIVLIVTVSEVMKERARGGGKNKELNIVLQELRNVRDEIRQIRQQNNDVVLHLDTTVQRLDRRVDNLESRASLGAGEEPLTRT